MPTDLLENMKHLLKTFTTCFLLTTAFLFAANAQTKKPVRPKKTLPAPTKTVNPIRVIKSTEPIIGGVVNGKAIFLPKPPYPEESRKSKVSGTVGVRVLIDENGNVLSAKAETGIDDLLLKTACEKVAIQAKFSPTTLGGKPVKVSGIINYSFVLNEEPKKRNEEIKFVGLGFFLSTIYNSAGDSIRFNDLFDFKDFKAEFADEFGNFSDDIVKEVGTLSNLPELDEKQKLEAIDKVIYSILDKSSESDLWQFKLGKDFGDLLGIFTKAVDNKGFNPDKLDENAVKATVANINNLLKSAPPEFPAKILKKFNELTESADKLNLADTKSMESFSEKLTALIEAISIN